MAALFLRPYYSAFYNPLFNDSYHSSRSSAQLQFAPILRGYEFPNYQETEIVRGQIPGNIFDRDLTQLEEETDWKITFDAGTGIFYIDKV